MNIVFMGGEVPSHRILLADAGVKHIGVSYYRLVKRGLPKTKEYLLDERFPEDIKIYIDGGGHQLNDLNLSQRELEEYAASYQDWLVINQDRITLATEIDSKVLGTNWINHERRTFWEDFGLDKFSAVWHQDTGHTALYGLAERYPNVSLLGESLEDDTSLAARTRALLSQFPDLQFHGVACAKPDNLRQVPLATASTLSWLSPMMRGETIVWDGARLVRYQKKMKDQARPRYKAIIEKAGLDFDKIINDDSNEVTRLAIWSYLQLEASLEKKKNHLTIVNDEKLSDNSVHIDSAGSAETRGLEPDNRGVEVRKDFTPRKPEEIRTLPVFGVSTKTIIDKDADGRDVVRDATILESTSTSFRQCNTCFVASNCPAFKPNNSCAFNLPVEVKTKEQLKSLLNAIIEMQGARVAFARFAEELNGGYPDPNTGQEIDRLFKIVGEIKKLEENKEVLRMTVERQTSGGVMSALFGDRANTLKELPNNGLTEGDASKIIKDHLEG
jgi:hypothetical protein